jgi:dTMP kinase
VVCDRFSSATFAYQVWAGQVEADTFAALDGAAREPLSRIPGRTEAYPDLTLLLDVDPVLGFQRKALEADARLDRIESKGEAFHARVRQGFLEYARRLGDRAVVLPGDLEVPDLQERIWELLGLVG